jgi:hypothetical protein
VEEKRWAAAHYRVERDWTGAVMRERQRRKATEAAIEHGDPVPDLPNDVVRIYDREGEMVYEQIWGNRRSEAMAHEAQIVDDLLKLDVVRFAAKYGIADPPIVNEPATPGDEALDEASDEAGSAGRSEQGSG